MYYLHGSPGETTQSDGRLGNFPLYGKQPPDHCLQHAKARKHCARCYQRIRYRNAGKPTLQLSSSVDERLTKSAVLSIHKQRFTIYGAARASNTLIEGEMPVPLFTEFFMSEKDVIKETKPRMDAAIDDVRRKLVTVRTGRAAVSLLDNLQVDYYARPTPLKQLH